MPSLTNFRIEAFLLLGSLFVFSASLYFQYVEGLVPCPLCLMQRFCIFALLLSLSTMMIVKKPVLIKRCLVIQILVAAAGIFFAGRQLWIQAMPAGQSMVCVPGLEIMIQYFPWQDIMKALFWGSGDCAEAQWSWLGLSMAAWSLFYFLVMITGSLYLFMTADFQKKS